MTYEQNLNFKFKLDTCHISNDDSIYIDSVYRINPNFFGNLLILKEKSLARFQFSPLSPSKYWVLLRKCKSKPASLITKLEAQNARRIASNPTQTNQLDKSSPIMFYQKHVWFLVKD